MGDVWVGGECVWLWREVCEWWGVCGGVCVVRCVWWGVLVCVCVVRCVTYPEVEETTRVLGFHVSKELIVDTISVTTWVWEKWVCVRICTLIHSPHTSPHIHTPTHKHFPSHPHNTQTLPLTPTQHTQTLPLTHTQALITHPLTVALIVTLDELRKVATFPNTVEMSMRNVWVCNNVALEDMLANLDTSVIVIP